MLQVIRVPDFDGAIAEAQRHALRPRRLADRRQDPQLYDRFWAKSRAGIVNWNRPTNGASSARAVRRRRHSGNHRPSAYYAADYCAYPVVSSEPNRPGLRSGSG